MSNSSWEEEREAKIRNAYLRKKLRDRKEVRVRVGTILSMPIQLLIWYVALRLVHSIFGGAIDVMIFLGVAGAAAIIGANLVFLSYWNPSEDYD
jgi:hypothetical protein